MTPRDRMMWLSGLSGLALIAIGGALYYQQRRKASGLGRLRGTIGQAPVIGGYSDGNMKTTLRASADMPIEQRLATIQDLVHKSVQDPEMRKLALQVTSKCPERDGMCESKAIYAFVKQNVRYTGDVAPIAMPDGTVEGIDLYQSARRTLEFGGGDCDDHSILIATLLSLNGITPRLRVVKQASDEDWSHIYPGAQLPKFAPEKFVALDTTLPGNKFGVEAPHTDELDFAA